MAVPVDAELPHRPGRPSSFVPAGTELDLWRGDAVVSVVGFRFVDTRVLGLPIPFHRDFDEVNLRFYVRRLVNGEVRRAVTFLREVVPRRAIALVARVAYNEPYITCRMRSEAPDIPAVADPGRVAYSWRHRGRWNAIRVRSAGPARALEPGSEAEFITEHYWGYTPQRDGGTVEYKCAIRRGASGRSPTPSSTVTSRRCMAIGSSRR